VSFLKNKILGGEMKIILKFAFFLAVFIVLSGCFSVSTTVNLNRDGSGTLEEKFLIKPFDLFGSSDGGSGNVYDEEKLKADAAEYGEGVEFVSGKELAENGMKGYLATYKFADINKLRLNENFAGKAISSDAFGPATRSNLNEYITFTFNPGKTSQLKINYPEDLEIEDDEEDYEWEDEPEIDVEDEEMMTMMKEIYDGMHFSMVINFNGIIKKTNATYQEGNSIILMDVDFSKMTDDPAMMKVLAESQDMTPEELQNMVKNMEGVKVETGDEITVDFN
jgi:hypothetical protein